MQYHVLRNVLVRNATVVLFTESEPDDQPESLRVFQLEGAGPADWRSFDVDLQYETVLAGEADPFAACAFLA
jgi:hypothetical protein